MFEKGTSMSHLFCCEFLKKRGWLKMNSPVGATCVIFIIQAYSPNRTASLRDLYTRAVWCSRVVDSLLPLSRWERTVMCSTQTIPLVCTSVNPGVVWQQCECNRVMTQTNWRKNSSSFHCAIAEKDAFGIPSGGLITNTPRCKNPAIVCPFIPHYSNSCTSLAVHFYSIQQT